MQESAKFLFPSSQDIWYAGQLKAFAARLPAVAHRYDLSMVTVLKVQCMALEFMELLIHRMHYAAEHLRQRQHVAATSLQMHPELAANWNYYKKLLQDFMQKLVRHITQHTAYTTADGSTLSLSAFACPTIGSVSLSPYAESPQSTWHPYSAVYPRFFSPQPIC